MAKKTSVVLYLVLALGLTWALWIPALIGSTRLGYPLPTIDYLLKQRAFQVQDGTHLALVMAFTLAVYGPLLGALAASWRAGGASEVARWFAPVLNWRIGLRWYGWMVALAAALVVFPLGAGWLLGLVTPQAEVTFPSIGLLLGLFIYQMLTSGLGEEPGWRAFLFRRWQATAGLEKAIWWTGLVWALWHFPFTIFFTLQQAPGLALPAQLALLLPSLLGQTMSLIGIMYLYAWIVNRSQSVFIAILFHALTNTFNALAASLVTMNPIVSLAIAATPWLAVFVAEKLGGKNWSADPNLAAPGAE